ncbi:MAG: hypothetical protein ACE5E5_10095 [Phycisphaerae bacterium]
MPQFKLVCTGTVKRAIATDKINVNFGAIESNAEPQTGSLLLTRADGGPIHPTIASTLDPAIHANIKELVAGEKYQFDVTVDPPFPYGNFRRAIGINTGVKEAPNMAIQVVARVIPRLSAIPAAMMLRKGRGQAVNSQVVLKWTGGKRGKILSTECTIPGATVEFKETEKEQRIILTMPASERPPNGSQHILVKTDDAGSPELIIPVRIYGQRIVNKRAARTRITRKPHPGNPNRLRGRNARLTTGAKGVSLKSARRKVPAKGAKAKSVTKQPEKKP